MNLNLTENQKRILTSVVVALVLAVAALLGYEVKQTPTAPETEIGVQALANQGIKCGASADPCVISNWGRDLNVYSDEQSTSKFSVDGATGNVVAAGSLGANSGTFSTPLAAGQFVAPTAQPTFAYTAPTAELYVGATPAAAREQCKTVNVIGSATVTFVGISTPAAMSATFSGDPGVNSDKLYTTTGSGVFTVFASLTTAGTPAPATTLVAVDVCGKGN